MGTTPSRATAHRMGTDELDVAQLQLIEPRYVDGEYRIIHGIEIYDPARVRPSYANDNPLSMAACIEIY